MQITMQRTRPAWPAKTKLRMTLNCSRIAKEIAMMSGIYWGRYCFILARDKDKKDHKKLRRKLVDHCPKQNETGRSEEANLETQKQIKWIEMHQSQVNMGFLERSTKNIDGTENPKFLRSLQNGQRDTTNLAITPINVKFAKTIDFYRLIYCLVNQHDLLAR